MIKTIETLEDAVSVLNSNNHRCQMWRVDNSGSKPYLSTASGRTMMEIEAIGTAKEYLARAKAKAKAARVKVKL